MKILYLCLCLLLTGNVYAQEAVPSNDRWTPPEGDHPYKGTPEEAAKAFLREYYRELSLPEDVLAHLKVARVVESPAGPMVFFNQFHDALQVTGGEILVDFDKAHHVRTVFNRYVRGINISPDPVLSAAQAVEVAQKDLMEHGIDYYDKDGARHITLEHLPEPDGKPVLGILSDPGAPARSVYDLDIAGVRYAIDANTGGIIRKYYIAIMD